MKHQHRKHEEKHFTASELVKDIVIGMADGLTVPFALAAGLSGAVNNNSIIINSNTSHANDLEAFKLIDLLNLINKLFMTNITDHTH